MLAGLWSDFDAHVRSYLVDGKSASIQVISWYFYSLGAPKAIAIVVDSL